MRKRSESLDFSAVPGRGAPSDCCPTPPGPVKIGRPPAGEPASKAASSTVQPCVESGLHRTPTFVRARPAATEDDASAPPPQASSPGMRKSETGKAVDTVP